MTEYHVVHNSAFCPSLLRFQLPESPRWLITRGRLDEANQIVTSMEQRAMRRLSQLPPVGSEMHVNDGEMRITYVELLSNPMYLRRTIVLFLMWFVAFITVYGIGVGLTTILVSLGYPPPEAGLIAAFGTFGFIAVAAIGSIILFIGFNMFVPMTWAWSAENYPTRARATGFALVDGIGHIGGGVGIIALAPLFPTLGPVVTFLILGGFLVVASVIAQFGTATRQKRLDEVSP